MLCGGGGGCGGGGVAKLNSFFSFMGWDSLRGAVGGLGSGRLIWVGVGVVQRA